MRSYNTLIAGRLCYIPLSSNGLQLNALKCNDLACRLSFGRLRCTTGDVLGLKKTGRFSNQRVVKRTLLRTTPHSALSTLDTRLRKQKQTRKKTKRTKETQPDSPSDRYLRGRRWIEKSWESNLTIHPFQVGSDFPQTTQLLRRVIKQRP